MAEEQPIPGALQGALTAALGGTTERKPEPAPEITPPESTSPESTSPNKPREQAAATSQRPQGNRENRPPREGGPPRENRPPREGPPREGGGPPRQGAPGGRPAGGEHREGRGGPPERGGDRGAERGGDRRPE